MSSARGERGERQSGGGLKLPARFALSMTLALSVVMAAAGFFLFQTTNEIVNDAVYATRRDATRLLAEGEVERIKDPSARIYEQTKDTASLTEGNRLKRFEVQITKGTHKAEHAYLYRWDERGNLLSTVASIDDSTGQLLGLFIGVSAAVILVAAGVAVMVATKVTKPVEALVNDVRAIGRGNLRHRSQVNAGGEVGLLARQIDRMAGALEEAQDAEIELGMREREREVASEVQEALLPQAPPEVPGYQIASRHVGAPEPGGDFHDMFMAKNRLVLLVCDVSGTGIPGALVGATARAYIKSELARGGDLTEALKKINHEIARDVRRGMYVTAMCVVLDPEENIATVACAGHKVPLIRWEAAEGNVRLVQPEGIALGFDKGPIFDRGLVLLRVPVEPGDRLVLSNTGPPAVLNPDGGEVGEKAFYRAVARNAQHPPEVMLKRLLTGLEKFADGEPFPRDISVVTLARDA